MPKPRAATFFAAALLAVAAAPPALADGPSDASRASLGASLEASIHATDATLALIPAGSALVVTAVRATGASVELVVVSAATGAEFVISLAAHTVAAAGIVVGTSLVLVAVATGWVIEEAGEIIAYVPDEATRARMHRSPVKP